MVREIIVLYLLDRVYWCAVLGLKQLFTMFTGLECHLFNTKIK